MAKIETAHFKGPNILESNDNVYRLCWKWATDAPMSEEVRKNMHEFIVALKADRFIQFASLCDIVVYDQGNDIVVVFANGIHRNRFLVQLPFQDSMTWESVVKSMSDGMHRFAVWKEQVWGPELKMMNRKAEERVACEVILKGLQEIIQSMKKGTTK